MVLMTPAMSAFKHDPLFDNFLFAEVGEEQNGMSLSVVSALARLDLDPWSEAASLSRLSKRVAGERLTSLLSSLPRSQVVALDPATVVRLIELLPRPRKDEAWTGGPVGFGPSRASAFSRPTR
jgi:hypothetical protein